MIFSKQIQLNRRVQFQGLMVLLAYFALITPAWASKRYARWLAIGDSITAHGPNAALQWGGETRGMAASKLEHDYVHLLRKKLQVRDAKAATELKIVGRFGKLSSGTIEAFEPVLKELQAWNADLVTIQLGENDRFREIGAAEFERRYRALVDGVLASPKRPVIVCTGVWSPITVPGQAALENYPAGSEARQKDEIIAAICREKGLIFVPVAPFATNAANHGDGAVEGVRWHPNDAGMRAYAEAIFAALAQDIAADVEK